MEMDKKINEEKHRFEYTWDYLRGFSDLCLTKVKALFSHTNPTHSPKLPMQLGQHSFTGCKLET